MASSVRKSTSILIVESDQVVQHILPLKIAEIQLGKASIGELAYTQSSSIRKKLHTDSDVSDSDDDDHNSYYLDVPAARPDESESILGKEIFQFRTPKKSGQMAIKARASCSPATPKSKHAGRYGSPQGTPTSPGQRNGSKASSLKSQSRSLTDTGPETPRRSSRAAASRSYKRMESSTPYRLRKRNLNLEQPDSSSDDSVDESSDEMEEDEDLEEENNDGKHQGPEGASGKRDDMNMVATAESYFELHSAAPVTSDRTLLSLDGPRLDVDTIREILQQGEVSHRKQVDSLMEKYAGLFNKWMFNMCCGYNILLHGLGSKRTLVEKFREKHLSKFSHLVVNGYFPSLTVKHILNSITEEILGCSKGFSSVHSQIEYITNAYKSLDEDFYLVIHNIDGVLLRSDKSQAALSLLSEIPGFHIIASVDHINAVFMWDQNRYFRFHWLWYETPTFLPYEAENGYENSLMVQQSGTLALSSIVHVMRSLTPNARQIFLLLAQHQMEDGDSPNYAGMSFQNLYHKCREGFLVNSDLTLQAQLVEFKDHRLIRSKKNYEGIEHLIIPLDRTTLKEFLQEHKDSVR